MRTATPHHDNWVLLTGATGFVGAALAHELLLRDRRVLCLVRAETPAAARERISRSLQPWTKDVERLLEVGRLAVIRGDLHHPTAGVTDAVRTALRGRIRSLIHAAGSTRFTATATGEPARTNVDGTRQVLALADNLDCRDWHLISTAYVAGAQRLAVESISDSPPPFHNDYEHSKWTMECLAQDAACPSNASLTIYRPSVVVGHSQTGQATRFVGIYYLFRATAMLARAAEQRPDVDRHSLSLRIAARSDARPNLICIDDVAALFGELFERNDARGGVYHLTHHEPPTNACIRNALEAFYDVAGGRFDDETLHHLNADSKSAPPIDDFQGLFDDMTKQVQDYLFDAPKFDRKQVSRLVNRVPAAWTDERLLRMIEAAESAGWRSADEDRTENSDSNEFAAYFQGHLASHIAGSSLGAARQIDVAVRFIIGRRPQGQWWCKFRDGRLEAVEPGGDRPADVTYRTSTARFWAAVAGEITGAELFLSGEAQIEGDIERALKFAAMLEEFVREHPYARRCPVDKATCTETS